MAKEYVDKEVLTNIMINGLFPNKKIENAFDVLRAIEQAPTADVVEVVRCGQCKLWKINPNNLYGGQCRYSECASIDHFCSYGGRKTNE